MFEDKYLYSGTDVLKNKQNIRDADQLAKYERGVTSLRIAELRQHPAHGDFDLPHLQRIHKSIFRDVYSWAGELRTVDIVKGRPGDRTLFSFSDDIKSEAEKFSKRIQGSNYLRGLDKSEFSKHLAELYSDLNKIHPFREGNGRASREFFFQLAEKAGYDLNFAKTNKVTWIDASKEAARGDTTKLAGIFFEISTHERALAFQKLHQNAALVKFPELDSVYKNMAVAAAKSPSDLDSTRAKMLLTLEQGKLPPSSVTKSESLKVTELVAAGRGLIVRDAKSLGGEFSGHIVAVTSRHSLLKVGDQIAVRYESGNLDRPVNVGDAVSIRFSEEKSAVTKQGIAEPHREAITHRESEIGQLRNGEKTITRVEYSLSNNPDQVKITMHGGGEKPDVVMSDVGRLSSLLGDANAAHVLSDLKTSRYGYLSGEHLYDKTVTIDRALELERGRTLSELAVDDYVKYSGKLVRLPDTNHGNYSGPVVLVTDHHVLQTLGPQVVIQHSLANFTSGDSPKVGEKVDVTYQQGEAKVAAINNDKAMQFDRTIDHSYGPR